MIAQYECCILAVDLPQYGLRAGARGVVVEHTTDGVGYIVEFIVAEVTENVAFVESDQVLPDKSAPAHGKARCFLDFGYETANWTALQRDLKQHAVENKVVRQVEREQDKFYFVEGPLLTPDGRRPCFHTVWKINRGKDIPEFVTAYPVRGNTTRIRP